MSLIRVSRKGQITIPKEIRELLGIAEGDYVVVRVEGNRIVIEKPSIPEPGEPVGEELYKELVRELDELREHWR